MNALSILKGFLIVGLMILLSGCMGFRSTQATGWLMEGYDIASEEELNQPESVPKLIKATNDRNERIRLAAVESLVALGPEAAPAIENLKILAVSDRNLTVRRLSLRGLIRAVGSDHEHSLYVLKHTLTDQQRRNVGQRAGILRVLRTESLGPEAINFLEEVATIERHPNIKADMLQLALTKRMNNADK